MKINKLMVFMLLIYLTFLPFKVVIASPEFVEDENDHEQELYEQLRLDDIQEHWQLLQTEYGGYLPELTKVSVYDMIKNNQTFSIKSFFVGTLTFLFHELIVNGKLLGLLIMLTLFSVILQTIHSAFEQSTVSKIAYFIVYIVLIYVALNSFYLVFTYTKQTVDLMISFMIGLIPLLLGLIAAFGSLMTVAFFHPIIIFLTHFSSLLISSFILPLLYLSALLIIVSTLSDRFQVTQLADLFKTISLGTLGAFLTVFLGVMSVQGASSAIQDGIAMKTAKFITGNFIPVIGRTFTDAADTVLSASLLLKNAIGLLGVIIVVLVALFPALKIFAIAIIYKFAAAILQPLDNGSIVMSLNIISKYIIYVLACLLAVTFMFFLSIVLITVASNITLLLK